MSVINMLSHWFMCSRVGRVAGVLLFALFMHAAMGGPAWAVTLGEVGENIANQASGMAQGVVWVGYAVGVGMVIAGIIMFTNAQKRQSGIGGPLILVIAGIMLLSVTAIISMGSESIFGSDESSQGFSKLGL